MKTSLRNSINFIKACSTSIGSRFTILNLKSVTALALIAVAFFSCEEPILTDTSLLPSDDNFSVDGFDTVTVVTTTELQDSLPTDNTLFATFGQTADLPEFGSMRAAIYMQFRLPTNNVDLGDSLELDSLVLSIRYNGQYGDLDNPVDIELYELTDQLDIVNRYYNFSTLGSFNINLAQNANQILNTEDSVFLFEGGKPAQLRIRIDDAWGQNLLNQSGSTNFEDNTSFRNYFPGFVLTSSHTNGDGYAYFNMTNVDSRLNLYYRNSIADSLLFTFPIGDQSAYFTGSEPDYTGSIAEQLLNGNSPSEGDSIFLTQSLGGLRGKVEFPYLQNLQDVAINRAELVVTMDESDTSLPFPTSMIAASVEEFNNPAFDLRNDIYEGFLNFLNVYYFSGAPEERNVNGENKIQYVFNVSNYVQDVVNGSSPNQGLYLFPFLDNFRAGRATFYGGSHSKYPVKLNLIYTKIE